MNNLDIIYNKRFVAKNEKRRLLWQTLCTYEFQKYIDPANDTVLDLGAGFCEFINNIKAKKKYAVDLKKDLSKFAEHDVEALVTSSSNIKSILDGSVDVVFVSNFLEHLPNSYAVLETLSEVRRILKPEGRVIILQPNILYTKEAYWDFIDHHTALTHNSLREALEVTGFNISKIKKRFLPYTTKSFLPINFLIIRIYLATPLLQQIFGKQTLIVANKI